MIANTHAILLAAGAGTRFGGGKLTIEWRGEPLVRAAARIALASPAERVTAVVGHDASAVSEALAALNDPRLSIVKNDCWADGLSSSLATGLRALSKSTEYVFLFLADMPLIDKGLAAQLFKVLADAPAILPTYGGKAAHPVIFKASLISRLLLIEGDYGARSVLADLPRVRFVEIDDLGATFDVDTRDDLMASASNVSDR